jgi:hypothetical protein
MVRLGILVLALGLAGCSSRQPEACSMAGEWLADIGTTSDAPTTLTPDGPDHFVVELVGKGVNVGTARWMPAERRLEMDFPSQAYRCPVAADCRSMVCRAQGSAEMPVRRRGAPSPR